MIIEAIKNLYPNAVTIYGDGEKVLDVNGKEIKIDFNKVKERMLILEKENHLKNIENSLMSLVDSKQNSAVKLILGYKFTDKQIERYRDKYERAKDGEFSAEVNAIVIEKFEAMRNAIRGFTDLIEFYRSAVDDLIQDGELEKAEKAIGLGAEIGINATKDFITTMLAEL